MPYFGIFDEQERETCSEYLKNNFLSILLDNKNFPFDIKSSITETFEKIEEELLNQNKGKSKEEKNQSGSCVLVCIINGNKIYIANIGDNGTIMSINGGTKVKQLTIDHKPNDINEYEIIIKHGAKVYVDDNYQEDEQGKYYVSKFKYFLKKRRNFKKYDKQKEIIYRHYPSNLANMRSIGDLKANYKEYVGLKRNIIVVPEIFVGDYSHTDDFIIIGCDGIYDDLSNEEIIIAGWYIFKNKAKEKNFDINTLSKDSCNIIIKYGMDLLTSDNLSCIVIGLEGLQKFLNLKKYKENK